MSLNSSQQSALPGLYEGDWDTLQALLENDDYQPQLLPVLCLPADPSFLPIDDDIRGRARMQLSLKGVGRILLPLSGPAERSVLDAALDRWSHVAAGIHHLLDLTRPGEQSTAEPDITGIPPPSKVSEATLGS